MCKQKGNTFCSELGLEVSKWSTQTPLAKPAWIESLFADLMTTQNLAQEGRIEEARQVLTNSPDHKLRDWFSVHGQNSGVWRFKAFGSLRATVTGLADPNKSFSKFEKSLFERDNLHCRYCGSNVVAKKDFKVLQSVVGEEVLPLEGTNAGRSGYYLMFCATLDHVIPHSLGGQTDKDNLVTSCWSCNYGKSNFTLEQIGLDDPFSRPPVLSRA